MHAATFTVLIALDWKIKDTTSHQCNRERWKLTCVLQDVLWRRPLAAIFSSGAHLSEGTTKLSSNPRKIGLTINSRKTKMDQGTMVARETAK